MRLSIQRERDEETKKDALNIMKNNKLKLKVYKKYLRDLYKV